MGYRTTRRQMKAKAAPEPREYIGRGRITLDGVEFTIIASSQEEADAKAARGEWHDYDIGGASSLDCRIGDVEPNE